MAFPLVFFFLSVFPIVTFLSICCPLSYNVPWPLLFLNFNCLYYVIYFCLLSSISIFLIHYSDTQHQFLHPSLSSFQLSFQRLVHVHVSDLYVMTGRTHYLKNFCLYHNSRELLSVVFFKSTSAQSYQSFISCSCEEFACISCVHYTILFTVSRASSWMIICLIRTFSYLTSPVDLQCIVLPSYASEHQKKNNV